LRNISGGPMNVSAAIRFPFQGAHVWPNLGCVLVCLLIPVVGPIVLLGYIIGVQRALLALPEADAPRFDFGKFSFYLTRGVWPFLVRLVLSLAILPFAWAIMMAAIVGMALIKDHPGVGMALIVIGALAYLVVIVLFSLAALPLGLKAGLQESFGAGFDVRFLGDYLKRVGWLSLGVHLVMFLALVPVTIVAACCLFFGPYALMAIVVFMQAHLEIQLYREYLRRGGSAIALKPEPPEPAFPVQVASPPPMGGNA
jgi:hypothetical protein